MNRRAFFLFAAPFCALALFILISPAAAQTTGGHMHGEMTMPTTGLQAELIQDVEQLGSKYLGLAQVMTDHYEWRPEEGVRSVSEVFMHIANANVMIATIAGAEMPASLQGVDMREREKMTDPQAVQAALQESFDFAKHAIAALPEADLETQVNLFGQDASKRRVLLLLVNHMHEHLGQGIAYARTNGVTPPWSE